MRVHPQHPRHRAHHVSIRARLCSRAMPASVSAPAWCRCCFNPRPALQPGDARRAPESCWRSECFNPRPALQPGDAPHSRPRFARAYRFNPRPALQPGDALRRFRRQQQHRVSIRARLCSRAMPPAARGSPPRSRDVSIRARLCSRAMQYAVKFADLADPVSIRARLCSRAMRANLRQTNLIDRVSIRARLCSRAMPGRSRPRGSRSTFQSAPGFAAGRCRGSRRTPCRPGCFNPRPALQPGDASQHRLDPQPLVVSIRARLCSRAMHRQRGGDQLPAPVSIRARLCSRAMHIGAGQIAQRPAFQSAPGFAAGRCLLPDSTKGAGLSFQSAPGFAAGRCTSCGLGSSTRGGFNPRPALQPGDACIPHEVLPEPEVSIRARLCSRAMLMTMDESDRRIEFQSAPGFAAGRCRRMAACACWSCRFQSAPGFAAGRCRPPRCPSCGRPLFQSAPGFAAGRCERPLTAGGTAPSFNPRPALQPGDAQLLASGDGEQKFQSAPGFAAGRCPAARWRSAARASFNPRPALQPGDATGTPPRRAR